MAKKAPPRRSRKSGPRPTRQSKGVPATSPVTLAQARALANVSPAAARRGKSVKAAQAAPSPASVGRERRRLRAHRELERRQRIRDYKATLAIMKRRGVKGLPPTGLRAERAGRAARAAAAPLQVFAEGDSWFDYPVPFFGGGIIPRLEARLGVPVLNLARAGDEVRYMLGVEERKILAAQFTRGCPAGGPWDALLFSGGGNDIVGDPMALWVRDFTQGSPPAALINQPHFDAALALVRSGYEELIALRDRLSPNTRLFFHDYDFAIPDGRGVCFLGPWLKPTFDLRGFPSRAAGAAVVRAILEQFGAMLHGLVTSHAGVTVIDTQGTLPATTASWHNELHPSKGGFNAFAALFHQALKAAFPTRVL
jgi:hypothetical protein